MVMRILGTRVVMCVVLVVVMRMILVCHSPLPPKMHEGQERGDRDRDHVQPGGVVPLKTGMGDRADRAWAGGN